MYEAHFSNQAKKFIKNLDKQRQKQIQETVNSLLKDPFSLPYKKLTGFEADYRVRVGEFRISYSVYKKEVLITFVKIGKRENFYA
ncbi:MAG: type II toxin-antitoxin system RelE/ParE family toxin [Candidatus Woesearchaeota archaeon]|nr:type II toxin-antitoxin system RelE/ParE family toxin [Nanoarchaeota archaeon]USN44146.1 MAG: type II toxin-antitoxin system RelE/ParE family toxin [Candidatus Woesearchaeota archaeon]